MKFSPYLNIVSRNRGHCRFYMCGYIRRINFTTCSYARLCSLYSSGISARGCGSYFRPFLVAKQVGKILGFGLGIASTRVIRYFRDIFLEGKPFPLPKRRTTAEQRSDSSSSDRESTSTSRIKVIPPLQLSKIRWQAGDDV